MSVYEFGPFNLDAGQLLLTHRDEPVALGPKVVETLLALVEHPGETLSKAAILDRVWPEGFVEEANLAQNIYVLRKTLREYWDAEAIATVPRRGYRFVPPVALVERVPAEPPVVHHVEIPAQPLSRSYWFFAIAAVFLIVLLGAAAYGVTHERQSAAPVLSAKGARLYAIGRYYWNQRTSTSVRKSMTYFSQVIDTDPRDARGYAAMADANAIVGDYNFGPAQPTVYYERARAYAQKALELDANSAEAYAILGMLENTDMTGDGINLLEHSIALDPNYGPAHQWLGIALLDRGRAHAALHELQIAAQLDPLSVSTATWLSSAAYLDRDYDDAIAYGHQALDLAPKRYDVLTILGLAYEARGDYAQAVATLNTFASSCKTCGAESAALLAHVYAAMHEAPLARMELSVAQSDPRNVSAEDVAIALAALGDKKGALEWFHRLKKHDKDFAFIALDPRMDVLRHDARFRDFTQGPA